MAAIRPVRASDSPALSAVCLRTAAAGTTAEQLHALPDLPGLVYALPYNHLATSFGLVLEDDERVVGYILGTTDTKTFEHVAEREWWPALRLRYPPDEHPEHEHRKPADVRYISLIHAPHIAPQDINERFPAHIHIDILPSHQRKSYGRALMAAAVSYLRERGHGGMYVGLDPANEPAKAFYARLGFERIDRPGGEWWGLEFGKFKG